MPYQLLGIGGSSIVSAASDGKTALKGMKSGIGTKCCAYREENGCEKLLAQEAYVYRLLGEHANILDSYGLIEVHPGVHSLRLERAPYSNVREFIRNNRANPPSQDDQLRMAPGISSGMAHAHAKNVMHRDNSCRNLFLFPSWCVKVRDLGSATVDGDPSRANIVEELRYELPRRGRAFEHRPSIKRELFALGSAIHEIVAWGMPFEDLETDDVEKKYAAEEFPDVTRLLAGDVIRDCWAESSIHREMSKRS